LKGKDQILRLIYGNITNTKQLCELIADTDVVLYFVSAMTPPFAEECPIRDVTESLMPTLGILDLLKSQKCRFVFASSGGTVYGIPMKIPLPETHPTIPISAYGVGKLATERYIQLYGYKHKLEYQILRFSNVYGPGQTGCFGQGVIGAWLYKLLHKQPIQIIKGDIVRDFIYVTDAADAVTVLVESNTWSDIYNIGSGEGLSLSQLLEMVCDVTGINPQVIMQPSRSMDVPVNVLDISNITRTTNWSPNIGVREGIAITWNWIREYYHVPFARNLSEISTSTRAKPAIHFAHELEIQSR
jgi:UDP-glucose 4-epimerase